MYNMYNMYNMYIIYCIYNINILYYIVICIISEFKTNKYILYIGTFVRLKLCNVYISLSKSSVVFHFPLAAQTATDIS